MADRRADARRGRRGATGPSLTAERETDDGRIVRIRSQDGLSLACRMLRCALRPTACRSSAFRGFRGTRAISSRSAQFFSRHPSEPRTVIAVDYRGRGLSDSDPNWRNYRPVVEAQDVLTVAAALGIERAILVGTSRGGIIAMLIGALRPDADRRRRAQRHRAGARRHGAWRESRAISRRRRTVANWTRRSRSLRSISGAQFPGLTEDDWQALAEAYFAETRRGLAPQYDPNLRKTVDRHRRDREDSGALAAVHEPRARAGPGDSRRALGSF